MYNYNVVSAGVRTCCSKGSPSDCFAYIFLQNIQT